MSSSCQHCGEREAAIQCGACHTGAWCSDECRGIAWPEHKPVCADLRLGRLSVAVTTAPSRDDYAPFDDRVKGLVLGGAVGDHVGKPYGMSLSSDYYWTHEDELDERMKGHGGDVSEATEMWIATAQGVLVEPNNADRGAARWLINWAAARDAVTADGSFIDGWLPPGASRLSASAAMRDRALRTAAATATRMQPLGPMLRASVFAAWNPGETQLTRPGARLEREVAQNVTLTHPGEPDLKHAAVAYALLCKRLVWGDKAGRGAAAIDAARVYLKRESPGGKALRALDDADTNAQLNWFDADLRVSSQIFSGGEDYSRALYVVVWFVRQAERNQNEQLWLPAVRAAVAAGGAMASLVGAALGAYYGQDVVSAELLGQVLTAGRTPSWLRAQRLVYLAEALGRL